MSINKIYPIARYNWSFNSVSINGGVINAPSNEIKAMTLELYLSAKEQPNRTTKSRIMTHKSNAALIKNPMPIARIIEPITANQFTDANFLINVVWAWEIDDVLGSWFIFGAVCTAVRGTSSGLPESVFSRRRILFSS